MLILLIMEKKELILIGEIVAASGIKGEVRVKSYSQSPERFGELDGVILSKQGDSEEDGIGSLVAAYNIERARVQGRMAVVKFRGVEDRNTAETLVGFKANIREEDLEELPEDSYYIRDLKGLYVFDDSTGQAVGTLKDVIQNSAQDIYVIETEKGDALVPAVKEFIREVNIEEGIIRINFIEGMLP